jgi:integrase/recombinase XerC
MPHLGAFLISSRELFFSFLALGLCTKKYTNNKYMSSVYTILRNEQAETGKSVLYLCVAIGKKRKYYSLKKAIDPKFWDKNSHQVKAREGNSTFLNNYIRDMEKKILEIFQYFRIEDKPLTLETFHNYYKKGGIDISRSFYEFFENEYEIQKKTISKSALEVYRKMKNKLISFAPNLTLAEVDYDFITRFEAYLLGECNLNRNTASKTLSIFRTYINSAYHKGFIKSYPFAKFKIKKGVSNRTYLTELEVRAITDLRLYNDGEANAQEMFLFACYTGLRFSDLINIGWDNIQDISNGKGEISKILSFENIKTRQITEIPLIKEALGILQKKDKTDKHIFKKITNQKLNEHLKTIQEKAGITKNLTAHMARHTFATLALTKGIDIATVSSLLGHTNLKTTQIYAKVINYKKIEEMKKFAFS